MWVAIPVLTWAASVPLAEGTFRLLGAAPPTELAGLYEQLPNGNYQHRPSVDTDANWFGASFSVHTDALGLRCDERRMFAVAPNTTVDWLIVGDSQAYGQGLVFSQTLTGTLIEQAAASSVRVANAAVGGHYLENQFELVRWLHEHSGLRARRFVVMLTPYLIASAGRLSRATVGPDGRLYGSAVDRLKQFLVEVKTHTVLYTKLRDAIRTAVLPPKTDEALLRAFSEEFEAGPAEARRTQALLDWLRSFREWARTQGAEIDLVYVPLTTEFAFDEARRFAAERGIQLDPESPSRAATAVARDLGLPLHDLRPALSEVAARGKPLSLPGDPHYNDVVSRACALQVWHTLRPSGAAAATNADSHGAVK